MSRKLILLNLALVAIAGWLGWMLRVRWLEAQAQERSIFQRAAHAKAVLPPPPLPQIRPVTPAEYIDVAQNLLFSKDRNPNVIIETPPPKPEPKMPALPFYFGQMTLGEPIVLLSSTSNGEQKSYHIGDKIGPFQVVTFDQDKITLDWNGKTVQRKLEDLAPPDAPPTAAVTAGPAASTAPAVKALTSPSPASAEDKNPQLGQDMGGGYRACAKGDNSPAGTVIGDYRKVISNGLMGQSCFWEKANK